MKIACLQFAPQVGDVDNNLDRADAVLNAVKEEVLDTLDLLVLPELALTGCNFKSLQHISTCLEHEDTGITSLWARTTALKHECAVIAGYPEKVDVTDNRPATPEYYNSALMVDQDGEFVGNYRKSHLYFTDETWALEGRDGFFDANVPGLGTVAMGICTDINPYKPETPWDAFEFGYHVMEVQANVVVLTMAWQTGQDPSQYSLEPKEPDLETLVYWVQRLEPLVCADKEDEVIVVFCNRAGSEGRVTYTGTSAVLGVKAGHVFVYGILGRGESGLLVVDTSQPPISKLTEQPTAEAESLEVEETTAFEIKSEPAPVKVAQRESLSLEMPKPEIKVTHPTPLSPRLPWLASDQTAQSPTNPRSPTKLQIPTSPTRLQIPTNTSRTVVGEFTLIDSALAENVVIESPNSSRSPSPADPMRRSKHSIPTTPWRFRDKQSPSPWHFNSGPHSAVFGGGACMTPITPFEVEDLWNRDSTPIDTKPPNWYWKHEQTLTALNESIQEEEEEEEEEEEKKPAKAPAISANHAAPSLLKSTLLNQTHNTLASFSSETNLDDATPIDEEPPDWYWKHEPTLAVLDESLEDEEEPASLSAAAPASTRTNAEYISTPIDEQPPDWYWKHEPSLSALDEDEEEEEEEEEEEDQKEPSYTTSKPERQPLTRSQSDNGHEEWQSLSGVLASLKIHPNSALNNIRSSTANSDPRPSSPKSRNASRHRPALEQRSSSPAGVSLGQSKAQYRPPSRLRHAISASSEDLDIIIDDDIQEEQELEPVRGRAGRFIRDRSTSRVHELSRGRQGNREGSIERSGSVGRSRLRYQPVVEHRQQTYDGEEEEEEDKAYNWPPQQQQKEQKEIGYSEGRLLSSFPSSSPARWDAHHPRGSVMDFVTTEDKRWGGLIDDNWEGEQQQEQEDEVRLPIVTNKAGGVASSTTSVSTSLGDDATISSIPSPETPDNNNNTYSMLSLRLDTKQQGEEKVAAVLDLGSAASLLNDEWGRRREEAVRRGQV